MEWYEFLIIVISLSWSLDHLYLTYQIRYYKKQRLGYMSFLGSLDDILSKENREHFKELMKLPRK